MATPEPGSACDFELGRYDRIGQFRALYTWLLFVFSVLLTGVLALAVVFAFDKKWVEAIVSGSTSVVAGGGIKFVLDRRGEAKSEEEAQAERVRTACGTQVAESAITHNNRLTVLGVR
jgi:hypothetical protein